MNLLYKLKCGKNQKWIYYTVNFLRCIFPQYICKALQERITAKAKLRDDYSYILARVNYYNKLNNRAILPTESPRLGKLKLKKRGSVYFFDSYEYIRFFDKTLQWNYCFGDITYIPDRPSIVKSRPIASNNENSVLLKLDKVRHFIFLKDKIPFQKKNNKIIFRGKVVNKPRRIQFMQQYFHHPMCDLGDVSRITQKTKKWNREKKTLFEHLDYKFILALEGNDVASNLKWVMSSNSIAVMPKPTYETWFMEGKLIPNFHYIEIMEDYSDLEERLNYYINHEEEALEIIKNAHEYVEPFKNKKREDIISLLVLKKYFFHTLQSECS